MFMQGLTLVDLDGDGVNDVFACHDDAVSKLWRGVQGGVPVPDAGLMPLTEYDFADYPDTDHSGNYSVLATDVDGDGDLDVHIAKCRQFINDPEDPRRVNQMWMNDGAGGWTEEAATRGLVLNEQSWTADFGDIDNDGDLDALVTNHSTTLSLLQNDGTGHFTDITAGSGLEVTGLFLQAKLADFDNDGFLDLLTSGNNVANYFFLGLGDGTFEVQPWPFDTGGDAVLSFAVGDVGRDGDLDVYATRGGVYVNPDLFHPDQLHVNEGSDHHWVAFDVQGVTGNLDAVGARVALYGAWGTQIREVRAGESYGITCTHHALFGLGEVAEIDSAVVRFASGLEVVLVSPEIDTYHEVLEAPCSLGEVAVEVQDTVLCEGVAIDLFVTTNGGECRWNTGDTASTLTVQAPGRYRALVTDSQGCAGLTEPVRIRSAESQQPQVGALGDLVGCNGDGSEVVLVAQGGGGVTWSTGETTNSITVMESGDYFVQTVDGCGDALSSDTLEVVRYPLPAAPSLSDEIVHMPAVVQLGPIGGNGLWYAEEGAEVPMAAGGEWTTPMLDSTSMFWVERIEINGSSFADGGAPAPGEGEFLNQGQFWLVFDAHRACILDSVTVQAGSAGVREFALVDAQGQIMDSISVHLEPGVTRVGLGFGIPEGEGLGLRCLDTQPDLWRDGAQSVLEFPYAVGELITIQSNNLDHPLNRTRYYYFFYDWQVTDPGVTCHSDRVPVEVKSWLEGCTYGNALNFLVQATVDNGSCLWTGCTDDEAVNYHPLANLDNGTCIFFTGGGGSVACPSDLDGDAAVGINDLLIVLGDFGGFCSD
jgi:hypothetical protein